MESASGSLCMHLRRAECPFTGRMTIIVHLGAMCPHTGGCIYLYPRADMYISHPEAVFYFSPRDLRSLSVTDCDIGVSHNVRAKLWLQAITAMFYFLDRNAIHKFNFVKKLINQFLPTCLYYYLFFCEIFFVRTFFSDTLNIVLASWFIARYDVSCNIVAIDRDEANRSVRLAVNRRIKR